MIQNIPVQYSSEYLPICVRSYNLTITFCTNKYIQQRDMILMTWVIPYVVFICVVNGSVC